MALLRRVIGALAVMYLLTASTDADWDHVLTFTGAGSDESRAPVVVHATLAPTATSPPSYGFCRSVAASDTTASVYDAATQQRMAESSFR